MNYLLYILVLIVIIESFLFGGLQYGLNSLGVILQEEGVYGHLCPKNYSNGTSGVCDEQMNMFVLAFSLSMIGFVGIVPYGYIIDKFDVHRSKWITVTIYSIGMLCFTFTAPGTDWLLLVGCIAIGFSSVQVLSSNLKVAYFFPRLKGVVISLVVGAYDSSAVNFQFMRTAWQAGLSLRISMTLYVTIGAVTMIGTSFLYRKVAMNVIRNELARNETNEKNANNITLCSVDWDMTGHWSNLALSDGLRLNPFNSIRKSNTNNSNENLLNQRLTVKNYCPSRSTWLMVSHIFWATLNTMIFIYLIGSLEISAVILSNNDEESVHYFSAYMSYTLMMSIFVAPFPGILCDLSRKVASTFTSKEHILNKYTMICPLILSTSFTISGTFILAFAKNEEALRSVCFITLLSRCFGSTMAVAFLANNYRAETYGLLLGVLFLFIAIGAQLQYPLCAWILKHNDLFAANLFISLVGISTLIHPIAIFFLADSSDTQNNNNNSLTLE